MFARVIRSFCSLGVKSQNLSNATIMFITAIEQAAEFTRPIHIITRMWNSPTVIPGAGTLFFVNADGWALTCSHIASHVLSTDGVNIRYKQFKGEVNGIAAGVPNRRKLVKELESKYGLTDTTPVETLNVFRNCADGVTEIDIKSHPSLDVSLLHFKNFTRLYPTTFPIFAADGAALKPGLFICRLGFPFPEFNNFEYDSDADETRWTNTGRTETPRFPIEGMVTRHLISQTGSVEGFEVSTPGLKGQSGGPAFDSDGRVWGMQAATGHLDLDFDVNLEVLRDGKKRRIQESAVLHVGHCIHVDILKQFMRDHGVAFQEG